jgi:hypothetical protein
VPETENSVLSGPISHLSVISSAHSVGNWMSATGGRLCARGGPDGRIRWPLGAPGGPDGRILWPHGRTRWAGREHLLARMDATGGAAPVARTDAERHLLLTWRLNGWIDHGRLRHLGPAGRGGARRRLAAGPAMGEYRLPCVDRAECRSCRGWRGRLQARPDEARRASWLSQRCC